MAASLVNRSVCFVRQLANSASILPQVPLKRCPLFAQNHIIARPYSSSDKGSSNLPENSDGTPQSQTQTATDTASFVNSSTSSSTSPGEEGALDKFAKVVDKVQKAKELSSIDSKHVIKEDPNESFTSMFRRSKFVSLGEHKDRFVQGEIFEVMEDDLYIDFGGKFHCVCPRPKRNGERYQRGTKVLLSLQAMEMSSAFLGSDIHVTLLEADATLLGLARNTPQRAQT